MRMRIRNPVSFHLSFLKHTSSSASVLSSHNILLSRPPISCPACSSGPHMCTQISSPPLRSLVCMQEIQFCWLIHTFLGSHAGPRRSLHSVDLRGLSSPHAGIPSKTYNLRPLQVSLVGYSYPVTCIFAALSITLSLVTTPLSGVLATSFLHFLSLR
jgi:hypothetical protein